MTPTPRTHLLLSGHPLERQRMEIAGGRAEAEALAGAPVTSFAFPYGDYDPEMLRVVAASGFARAYMSIHDQGLGRRRPLSAAARRGRPLGRRHFRAAHRRGVSPVSTARETPTRGTVSVIMIFLDAERFIEEAITSVFAQTWPHWELLLVDDGSRDGSTAIARRYAASDPDRVRYVEHPGHANRGTGPSRDLGLASARGVYVTFLDADDIYLPERLARHVAMLEASPEVDVAQSRHLVWFSWDDRGWPIDADHLAPSIEIFNQVIQPPICFFPMLACDALVPASWSLTLRRATALAVGGFEGAESLGSFDDVVFATKLYLSKRVVILDETLAKYRRHSASCTRRARDRGESVAGTRYPLRWGYLEWLERYLEEQGIDDPMVWQALREELPARRDRMHARLLHAHTLIQSRVRRYLAVVLPQRAYFGLMRWRREREVRRAALRLAWAMAAMARGGRRP